MPDSNDSSTAPPAEVDSLGLGERLMSARTARAITVEQVAHELHLDPSIIISLEQEQFEALGAPVFVRGHLRSYARLLGLDEGAVMQAYRRVAPGSDAPPLVLPPRPAPTEVNLGLWVFWVLVFIVAAAALYYLFQPVDEPLVEEIERSAPAVERVPPPAAEPATAVPDTEAVVLPGEPEAPADDAVSAVANTGGSIPQPAAAAPDGAAARLTLLFGQESWVEVSDAGGTMLLFGLQQPGTRRELSGKLPFRLVLGNAPSVNVYLDGDPYLIPPRSIRSNVARFEIAPVDAD